MTPALLLLAGSCLANPGEAGQSAIPPAAEVSQVRGEQGMMVPVIPPLRKNGPVQPAREPDLLPTIATATVPASVRAAEQAAIEVTLEEGPSGTVPPPGPPAQARPVTSIPAYAPAPQSARLISTEGSGSACACSTLPPAESYPQHRRLARLRAFLHGSRRAVVSEPVSEDVLLGGEVRGVWPADSTPAGVPSERVNP